MQNDQPGTVIAPKTESDLNIARNDSIAQEKVVSVAKVAVAEAVDSPVSPVMTGVQPGATSPTQQQTQAGLPEGAVQWRAPEFVNPEKNPGWYILMTLGVLILGAIVYLINRDIITSLILILALGGLGFFAGRRARDQVYTVAHQGIQVGNVFYSFGDYKSYSIIEESSGRSLILSPFKRFALAVSIALPAEYEAAVVSVVSSVLPMEKREQDLAEKIARRLHF